MKILFISQYYYPEPFKVNELAESFKNRGHDITVVTGLPNYPDGDIYKGYHHSSVYEENINDITVIRIPITPRGNNSITLLKNYISFSKNVHNFLKGYKEKFDCIFVYQLSPVFVLYPGYKLKQRDLIPLYCYCLDLWPESVKVIGLKESSFIYKILNKICNNLYSECDKIMVSSSSFINYLSNVNHFDRDRITFIPQHGEEELLNVRNKRSKGDFINITYAGNIGKAQNFEVLVKSILLLDEEDRNQLKVHIIGSGSELENLKKLVLQSNLTELFIFYGRKLKTELFSFYENTDILFISLRNQGEVANTIPTKLQTYLAVGRPILASITGDAKAIIQKANCGYAADLDDYEDLSKGIKYLMLENRQKLGENARDFFLKNYTLDIVTDLFINEITEK